MNVSLIGWSHPGSLIAKNLGQPWHMHMERKMLTLHCSSLEFTKSDTSKLSLPVWQQVYFRRIWDHRSFFSSEECRCVGSERERVRSTPYGFLSAQKSNQKFTHLLCKILYKCFSKQYSVKNRNFQWYNPISNHLRTCCELANVVYPLFFASKTAVT